MSNHTFEPYEYIAVIAPGAVVAAGLFTQWPELKLLADSKDVTIGELGLFVIASFILGHIVQAVGNLIETVLWRPLGGMPTEWVLKPGQSLLSSTQRERLVVLLGRQQGSEVDLSQLTRKAWYAITREIYSTVKRAGRSDRIDAFNRSYGLMRGIAAGFFVLTVWLVATNTSNVRYAVVSFVLGLAALYRTFRFGRNYGRELLVEYIALNSEPTPR